MKKGDNVKVKKGVMSPDYGDLKIEGWQGRITELGFNSVTIELDSLSLESLSKDYIIDSIVEDADYTEICLDIEDLELAKPRDTQNDTLLKQKEINARYSLDEEEKRILNVLKSNDSTVTEKNQGVYFKFLEENIQKPCILTGMEDFDWEEPYILGGWSKNEYEKLKLTQPSYTDKFEFISLVEDIDDWKGILIKVKRLSDNKKFDLPLWDLEVIDEKSPNYIIVSDYSSWMTNYQ
ncbi:MAG TPA: hypothetical protein DDX39_09420 [Bacteroidales bacterium]|nr:MAG: hypothetical protein A2W98_15325 [Bacteroidetes bacterium GWF2_33_38]OFY70539.1 MAG: hypothetical protein A2265_03280 [Bacteroidetes bacterium RIFOXYA12_FULL_33_9]OFY85923.1 MAG: hypothetical protein A2236_08795 [Bacteroidetes bacterium RIFOXYA2_FULL_33_7]HBF88848.1 hypothetical protein [Bacteroidales bacterium]